MLLIECFLYTQFGKPTILQGNVFRWDPEGGGKDDCREDERKIEE